LNWGLHVFKQMLYCLSQALSQTISSCLDNHNFQTCDLTSLMPCPLYCSSFSIQGLLYILKSNLKLLGFLSILRIKSKCSPWP
jgi:hypothetical protein